MSAPQHIGVGAPTGRLAGVREQTCRLPSKLALGSRQVGCLAFGSRPVGSPANCRWGADRSAVWRSGADLSAPQQIVVGEPTGRFPRTLSLGARHVGSLDTAPIPRMRTAPHIACLGCKACLHSETWCLINGGHDNDNGFGLR